MLALVLICFLASSAVASHSPGFVDDYWTQWFDKDNPGGTSDNERLDNLRSGYPGLICDDPTAIEARTLEGLPAEQTGQIFSVYDTTDGFRCINADQLDGSCHDYEVRFYCPPECADSDWTEWFNRDDPSGTGDWEFLSILQSEYPTICDTPTAIESQTTCGLDAETTDEIFLYNDRVHGFVCRVADQPDGACCDYQVRFCCP